MALCLAASAAHAHDASAAARQRLLNGGPLDFVWIGAEHMMTGYDHLLYLLGVLFFLTRASDVLKFVTVFTIGHVITLLGGTLLGGALLGAAVVPFAVDAVIGLSVAYKGFENLDGFRRWIGIRPPPMLLMVFGFGLIHGLGLAVRLRDMTLANDSALVGKVLWFNLGVELGQVAALAVMWLVLRAWRARVEPRRLGKIVNVALIVAGIGLAMLQVSLALGSADEHAMEA